MRVLLPFCGCAAQCYSDHRATIYTLAALWHLSDDEFRFKIRMVTIGKNTDLEIRVAQFVLRRLVVHAYDHGEPMFCGGRESVRV